MTAAAAALWWLSGGAVALAVLAARGLRRGDLHPLVLAAGLYLAVLSAAGWAWWLGGGR